MSKFKVGDKVRIIDKKVIVFDKVGIIKNIDYRDKFLPYEIDIPYIGTFHCKENILELVESNNNTNTYTLEEILRMPVDPNRTFKGSNGLKCYIDDNEELREKTTGDKVNVGMYLLDLTFEIVEYVKYIPFHIAFNEFWHNGRDLYCERSSGFVVKYDKTHAIDPWDIANGKFYLGEV